MNTPPPVPPADRGLHRQDMARRVALGLRGACLLLLILAVVFTVKATAFPPAPPSGPLQYGAATPNPLQSFNDELLALLLGVLSIASAAAAIAVDRGLRA